MRMINLRAVVLRFVIVGILFGLTYPFLPARQKWQIRATLGNEQADSLLNEYFTPPVEGALQFALEYNFGIEAGGRRIVDATDVRYVMLADRIWGGGKGTVWAVHLKRYAVEQLQKQLRDHPDETLWAVIDHDWRIPLDLSEASSPLFIDPSSDSDDPYAAATFLEPWYERPFLPPGVSLGFPGSP